MSLRMLFLMDSSVKVNIIAHILPRFMGRIPSSSITHTEWKHIAGLSLADPTFAQPGRVDLILGADVRAFIMLLYTMRWPPRTAQDTVLGWVVSGPSISNPVESVDATPLSKSLTGSPDYELNELISRFWAHEEVPSSKSIRLNADEEYCEQHFLNTHSRDPTGRYIVRLPFRTPKPFLGSSYNTAYRMLSRLQQRLHSDSTLSRLYIDFLQEYEMLSHMSRIANSSPSSAPVYFRPHHGVLREESLTTKLRVVFNGSSRITSGISLNECLHVRPKLQNDIFDILLNCRSYTYVFIADIEKMYRQIIIHPDDHRYQQILWSIVWSIVWRTRRISIQYDHLRSRALRIWLFHKGSRYPEAADIVLNEMYVFSGADTISQAFAKAGQLDRLLMAGGFRLHKWTSNESHVLAGIDSNHCVDMNPREFHAEFFARALGLSDPYEDVFVLQPRFTDSLSIFTKRSILSQVAQLFDSLRWISPISIVAKIFIQELWRLKIDWDEPLPESPTVH